jgi:hypothetical protein
MKGRHFYCHFPSENTETQEASTHLREKWACSLLIETVSLVFFPESVHCSYIEWQFIFSVPGYKGSKNLSLLHLLHSKVKDEC